MEQTETYQQTKTMEQKQTEHKTKSTNNNPMNQKHQKIKTFTYPFALPSKRRTFNSKQMKKNTFFIHQKQELSEKNKTDPSCGSLPITQ